MFKMVKSHWKHCQNMQKLYCGRGLSLHVVFFTSETVQIGRGKMGLSGNIQVKHIFQNLNLTFLILGRSIVYIYKI